MDLADREIRTERLLLRRYRESDLDRLAESAGTARGSAVPLLGAAFPRGGRAETLATRIAATRLERDDDWVVLAVERQEDGLLLCDVTIFLRSVEHRQAEVGWDLSPRRGRPRLRDRGVPRPDRPRLRHPSEPTASSPGPTAATIPPRPSAAASACGGRTTSASPSSSRAPGATNSSSPSSPPSIASPIPSLRSDQTPTSPTSLRSITPLGQWPNWLRHRSPKPAIPGSSPGCPVFAIPAVKRAQRLAVRD